MSKTLIVYATKHGSAEDCAKELAAKMNSDTRVADLKKEKSFDLTSYDKIIIGGSIYAGRIQKEVSEFCVKNIDVLKAKKIGLFICGMSEGETAEKQILSSFPQELLNAASAKESFGGKFDFNKMNFMEKMIVKKVAKVESSQANISESSIERLAQTMNQA